MVRVQVINEVSKGQKGDWILCLQWCRYLYDDGNMEQGYRFIWRRPNGALQPARGQARIPSLDWAQQLIDKAKKAGWGNQIGD
ncbi:MAG: hypothetical protein HYX79_09050 [Chloroflexi bacterium]|nr:hypothetical protein [Chloroflexota bacterium]